MLLVTLVALLSNIWNRGALGSSETVRIHLSGSIPKRGECHGKLVFGMVAFKTGLIFLHTCSPCPPKFSMSAMVFKHIFVNHRVVFKSGRESGEVAQDHEHEDTGCHHTSNLIKRHYKRTFDAHYKFWLIQRIIKRKADQYIFVPHRPSLYESYYSIRHPEHYIRKNQERSGWGFLP